MEVLLCRIFFLLFHVTVNDIYDCPSHFAGDLLMLLNVLSDEKILPTTYGELKPPLGKHRLKVGH